MIITELKSRLKPGCRAHLVGIGGVSMAPLAEVLHGMGVIVSGSDMKESKTVEHLRTLGIQVIIGHFAENVQGKDLVMTLGYSHLVTVSEIPGITIDVPGPNTIIIRGADKQLVGQFAAEVREKRPPEPYKGKGIKYADEVIRRKEGKTGGKGKK